MSIATDQLLEALRRRVTALEMKVDVQETKLENLIADLKALRERLGDIPKVQNRAGQARN